MADKELLVPLEEALIASQLDAIKTMLSTVTEQMEEAEGLSDSIKNEAEMFDLKKPTQAQVKSQLASCRKELKKTKQEVEKVKKALDLITELQKACFATISTNRKDVSNEKYKDLLPEILKESAEVLPLYLNENNEDPPPLCGAVQPEENYVAKAGDHVAAFVSVKNSASEWILAEVNNYSPETEEYTVQDIDDSQNTEYRVTKDRVIPLPNQRADPDSHPSALFPKGTLVLALYENTTCFYKGLVHEPPPRAVDPYQISFEDTDCASGYSQPTSVPQKYVIAYKTF